jgi:hypothetical protein
VTRAWRRRCVVAWPSGIDGQVARASWQGRGKALVAGPVGGGSRPIGGRALARLAGAGIVGQVAGGRCPLTGVSDLGT